jgi:hypothetical protein
MFIILLPDPNVHQPIRIAVMEHVSKTEKTAKVVTLLQKAP